MTGERDARRLSPEDLSILALEDDTVAGHMCKVIVLPGPVDLDLLRSSIGGRLARAPELSMCLGEIDGEHRQQQIKADFRRQRPRHAKACFDGRWQKRVHEEQVRDDRWHGWDQQ